MSKRGFSAWIWGDWSRVGLSTALATLIIDQAHKWYMINVFHIQDKGRVAVTPFLDLVWALNTGISYGLAANSIGQPALATFALLATIGLTVWLARGATGWLMAVSIGLIIGGAVGNAIDRMHLGGVADFFRLHAYGYSWYIFNVADVAIVAGVAGLLYDSFAPSRKDVAKGS